MRWLRLRVTHPCPFAAPAARSAAASVSHLCHRGREAMLEVHGGSPNLLGPLLEEYESIGGEVLLQEEGNPAALVRFSSCACCLTGKVIPTLEAGGNLYLPPSRYSGDGEDYQFLVPADASSVDELRDVTVLKVGTRPLTALGTDDSFLVPAANLLRELTPRQRWALITAYGRGYYRIPRAVSSAEMARDLGISREAFDTLLRKAEQKVLGGIYPYLSLLRPPDRTAPKGEQERRA
jgi:predicted DNA binding protein